MNFCFLCSSWSRWQEEQEQEESSTLISFSTFSLYINTPVVSHLSQDRSALYFWNHEAEFGAGSSAVPKPLRKGNAGFFVANKETSTGIGIVNILKIDSSRAVDPAFTFCGYGSSCFLNADPDLAAFLMRIRIQLKNVKNMELVKIYFKISNKMIIITNFLAVFLLFFKFSLMDPYPGGKM